MKKQFLKENNEGFIDMESLQKQILDLKNQKKIVENELFKIPEKQRSIGIIKQKEDLEQLLENLNKDINNLKTVLIRLKVIDLYIYI